MKPHLSAAPILAVMLAASAVRADDWPQWRGPHLNGTSEETGLPTKWSTTENVAWAVPLPGPGGSTPIITGDRVFLTSENPANGDLLALCYHRTTGALLWKKSVVPSQKGKRNNTMASPSAVTDGKTAWFTFGTGTVVAFDLDGKERWRRELEKDYGEFMVQYGYSSSPLLYRGKLYFVVLQAEDPNAYETARPADGRKIAESFLLALDPESGRTLWRHVRDSDATGESRESYTTPIPFEGSKVPEIILVGAEFVTAHDAATGRETWRWEFSPHKRELHKWSGASAVVDDSMIYVARPKRGGFYALKGGASGRVDDRILAWSYERYSPYVPTPLLYRNRLYLLQDNNGILTCLKPGTGKILYRQRLNNRGNMHPSPVGADGKIYLMDESGGVIVVEAGDTYKELHRTPMGGKYAWGSIAIAGGRLYIRTAEKLFCIGR